MSPFRQEGDHLWLTTSGPNREHCRQALARHLPPGAVLLRERWFTLEPDEVPAPPAGDCLSLRPIRPGPTGLVAHALAPGRPFHPIVYRDRTIGTRWEERDGSGFAVFSVPNVSLAPAPPEAEAEVLYGHLAEILGGLGAGLEHLARTWIWLEDILDWYSPFNEIRTRAYRTHGLISEEGTALHLPASTGIGLGVPSGRMALEALATLSRARPELRESAGNQRSAFAYGSAFARSVTLEFGDTPHLFVSGTASIDASGKTVCVDDPAGQAAHTLANVRAVLADHACGDADVLQAVVYAATPEAADAWRRIAPDWPALLVPAVVCRPDLLIEAEAVAALPSPRKQP